MDRFKLIVRYQDGSKKEYRVTDIWIPRIQNHIEIIDIEVEKL